MTDHKIVLITGANKGIGFATAQEFRRAGHTVLLGARDEQLGKTAADQIGAHFIRLDVTDQHTIDAAAKSIAAEHGRLDILINNAGISRDRDFHADPTQVPVTSVRAVYEVNVFGVVAVTNAMLPLLRESAAGYVGNVSSGLGTVGFLADPEHPLRDYAHLLAYNSSKAALNAITLIYATALREAGIRVNALSPGFCATDLNRHTGTSTAAEGGAAIVREVLGSGERTGVFLSEDGGSYPW